MDRQPEPTPLETLLKRYGESDHAAFTEFYGRTKTIVYGFIRRRVRNGADVDEVFQETYFRVHRYVASYDETKSGLFWILAIARNVICDRLGATRRQAHSDEAAVQAAVSPDTADSQAHFNDLLESTLSHLNREEQSILLDRVLLDRSFDEIGDRLQISAASARQRLSRTMRRLRTTYSY